MKYYMDEEGKEFFDSDFSMALEIIEKLKKRGLKYVGRGRKCFGCFGEGWCYEHQQVQAELAKKYPTDLINHAINWS